MLKGNSVRDLNLILVMTLFSSNYKTKSEQLYSNLEVLVKLKSNCISSWSVVIYVTLSLTLLTSSSHLGQSGTATF